MTEVNEQKGMHRRRIKLADGRYLLFYTFDELPAPQTETQDGDAARKPEPQPQPEAEEERRV